MKHLKSPLVRRRVNRLDVAGSPLAKSAQRIMARTLEDWLSAIREEVWASGKLRIAGFGTFSVQESLRTAPVAESERVGT